MTGEAPLSPSIGPDTQPVDRDGWSRIVEAARTEEDGAWVALPENGWGAVVAWAAGPGRARPHPIALDDRRPVRVHCENPHGTVHAWEEPFTVDDLADVEHLIADYCALAGIPTPPFTAWDLCPPDGVTLQDLEAAAFEEPTGHPVALVGVVRRLLAEP